MTITVTVTDMSCEGCEDIVEGAVADVSGVDSVEADRDTEAVTVEGDVDEDAVLEAITFAGYTPSPDDESAEEENQTGDVSDDTGDVEDADEDVEA